MWRSASAAGGRLRSGGALPVPPVCRTDIKLAFGSADAGGLSGTGRKTAALPWTHRDTTYSSKIFRAEYDYLFRSNAGSRTGSSATSRITPCSTDTGHDLKVRQHAGCLRGGMQLGDRRSTWIPVTRAWGVGSRWRMRPRWSRGWATSWWSAPSSRRSSSASRSTPGARHQRLTNEYHPCQILADIFTFIEHRGPIQGKTVAWVGDATTCATPGCRPPSCWTSRSVSTPPGYEGRARSRPAVSRTDHFVRSTTPMDACRGADLVTTDVWTSMGFEAENEERMRDFADWQVDADMMRVANPDACSCTACPPTGAWRFRPRWSTVPQSVVWEEAENRLHVQKALMEFLLIGKVEGDCAWARSGRFKTHLINRWKRHMSDVKKVVLAYSGGLDTSVILKWLQDTYQCEVVTFTADLGQGEELEAGSREGLQFGIKPENIFIDDLRESSCATSCSRCSAPTPFYEGDTCWARPSPARWSPSARSRSPNLATGADAGPTAPPARATTRSASSSVTTRWCRTWRSSPVARVGPAVPREAAGLRREERHPHRDEAQAGAAPHIRWTPTCCTSPSKAVTSRTRPPRPRSPCGAGRFPRSRPDAAEYVDLEFEKGDLVAINGTRMKAHELLAKLNELGGKHGIGRLDLVKTAMSAWSPGCYETRAAPSCCVPTAPSSRSPSTVKSPISRTTSCRVTPAWSTPVTGGRPSALRCRPWSTTPSRRSMAGSHQALQGNVIVVSRFKTDSLFDPTKKRWKFKIEW